MSAASGMPAPILATKLFPPPLRPNRVRRERLLTLLEAGLYGKLTLVSAPAGFGKSTVLAEFASRAAEQGYNRVWLSLDTDDSEPQRFWQYLVAALQQLDESIGSDALVLAQAHFQQAQAQTAELELPEAAITSLLNDLYRLQTPGMLVLDDYHLLEGGAVNALLQRLLDHWPAHLHLAIGTREDPALPLARMRARGEVNELRASDLRFSLDESAHFFSDTMRVPLPSADVQALEARTEGWIAGLQLAGVSLLRSDDKAGFIRDFTGSHRFVLDYLTEEVLHTQSDSVRQFLLQTSVFERFSAGLCEAVTGLPDSADILRQLEQGNMFLVGLDQQGQWFRFHHLFADMLRTHQSLSADEIRDIHGRASRWFEQQGLHADAIRHGLLAREYERVADLLDCYWDAMWFYSMERDLIEWVRALPESVWRNRPVITGYYAMALLSYDRTQGPALLRSAWAMIQSGTDDLIVRNPTAMETLPGVIAIGESYLAGAEGDVEQVLHWSAEALKRLPANDLKWRGAAHALRGMVFWSLGELDQAGECLADCLRIMEACGDLAGMVSSYYVLAANRVSQGDLQEGQRLIEQAFDKLDQLKPLQPQGTHEIWTLKAELALIQADLNGAEQALQTAAQLGLATRLPEESHKAAMLRARLAMMHNQTAQALEHLAEAESTRMPSPSPDVCPTDVLRARVWLMSGQIARVDQWLQEQNLNWTDEPMFLRESLHLTQVKCWLYRQEKQTNQEQQEQASESGASGEQVLTLLDRLQTLAQSQRRTISQIEIGFLQAQVCRQQQQLYAAEQHRQTALEYANRIGHQLWASQLQTLDVPLEYRSETTTETAAETLIKRKIALAQTDASASKPDNATPNTPGTEQATAPNTPGTEQATAPNMNGMAELDDPLSSRELDVLKLLATDLTGPQISEKLFVSLNTFRTHTKNIYAKLDVSNRQSALIKARGLGLI